MRLIDPLVWRILNTKRYEYAEYLNKKQYSPLKDNIATQHLLLKKTLRHAVAKIPYYHDLGIKSDKIRDFPILDKHVIRDNLDRLHIKTGEKVVRNTSGGTTGEPVVFYQDQTSNDWGAAVKIFYNWWAGYKEWQPLVKLWGNERDILGGPVDPKRLFEKHYMNVHVLNSFMMNEWDMDRYVKDINRLKPPMILAYVQSINELAKHIESKGLKVHSPKGIMTSAGTLHDDIKETIKRVFKCKIFNRYGSREVGNVACNCEKDEGMHLSIFNQYIEILNEEMEHCQEGEIGSIYVTTLTNFAMPLIRYKVGDMAMISDEPCSCGRGLPTIKKVVGREVDVFKTMDGYIVDGEYFTHLFYFKPVKKFQVIQKSLDKMVIKVVLEGELDKDEIEFACRKVMGDIEIEWEELDEIPPTSSGKFRFTISEVTR